MKIDRKLVSLLQIPSFDRKCRGRVALVSYIFCDAAGTSEYVALNNKLTGE